MQKAYDCWTPSVGDSITGRVLYFRHDDGSFIVLIRKGDRHFLLPSEAHEAFVIRRPKDGSVVTVTLTDAGYRWYGSKIASSLRQLSTFRRST